MASPSFNCAVPAQLMGRSHSRRSTAPGGRSCVPITSVSLNCAAPAQLMTWHSNLQLRRPPAQLNLRRRQGPKVIQLFESDETLVGSDSLCQSWRKITSHLARLWPGLKRKCG